MKRVRLLALLKVCVDISRGVPGRSFRTFRDELDEAYGIFDKLSSQQRDAEGEQKKAAEMMNGGEK